MIIKIFRKNKHGVHKITLDWEGFLLYQKYNWSFDRKPNTFYLKRNEYTNKKTKMFKFHRELLNITDSMTILDHANGDGLDNRLSNIRICSHSENNYNREQYTQKPKGIQKHGNKWRADIRVDKKRIYLGLFDSIEKAASAYDLAVLKYHGKFGRPNK